MLTVFEIWLLNTAFGNIECEILLEHVLNSNNSVKRLGLRNNTVSMNMVPRIVDIVTAWNVKEVCISFNWSQLQFYNYLIERLKEKCFIKEDKKECCSSYVSATNFESTVKIIRVKIMNQINKEVIALPFH